MKKILLLYNNWNGKCITGGQFYEENMYQCMSENHDFEIKRHSINRKRNFINKLFAPFYNLKNISLCNQYDLVILNSVTGWYFLPLVFLTRLFTKTKIAIIHHHFLYLEFKGLKRLFYKTLENRFLLSSNIIITVSPYIYELCKVKYKHRNVRFWPIPFTDEIYINKSNNRSHKLIYIGTIEPRKGLTYAIEALKILSERNIQYSFDIVGKIRDNNYYQKLCKEIENYDLNVKFHGFIVPEEKETLLLDAKIFLFPSLLEGYGMVLREAMAYGLPIVCFNNSAMPYLVKSNTNGIVVENKNAHKLADAIEKILKNDQLWRILSEGAYESTKLTPTPKSYKELLNKELRIITND